MAFDPTNSFGFQREMDVATLTYRCFYNYSPDGFLLSCTTEQRKKIEELQSSSLPSNQLLALAMIAASDECARAKMEEYRKKEEEEEVKVWRHCLPECCKYPDRERCGFAKYGGKEHYCPCLCHAENRMKASWVELDRYHASGK